MAVTSVSGVISEPFSQEFEELFREHHDLVYRTAYGVTGSIEDAEDIAQTIFLQVLRREVSVGLMKNPRGYFYRAAVNLSLTLVRSRARRTPMTDIEALAHSIPSQSSSETEEHHRKLYEEIAKLPAKAAEMLILRYQHGYNTQMIITGKGSMEAFAAALSRTLIYGPVLDKTALQGMYEVNATAIYPTPRAAQPGPGGQRSPALGGGPETSAMVHAVQSALQSQLGLRLEIGKVPEAFVVIEHVERPSEN